HNETASATDAATRSARMSLSCIDALLQACSPLRSQHNRLGDARCAPLARCGDTAHSRDQRLSCCAMAPLAAPISSAVVWNLLRWPAQKPAARGARAPGLAQPSPGPASGSPRSSLPYGL